MGYRTNVLKYDMLNLTFPTSAGDGPFISVANVSNVNGACKLDPAGTASAIWQNNDGPALASEILRVEMLTKLTAAAGAGDEVAWGLVGTYNVDPDTASPRILFRLSGSNEIKVETHNGTSGSGKIATGIVGKTSWQRTVIDLYTGVQTVAPPGQSKGGLGAVQFSVENAAGQLEPVAKTTLFDMSAISTTALQLYFSADGASVEAFMKNASVEVRD